MWLSRREDDERGARERIAGQLGLNDEEGRKVGEILGSMQSQRRDLFEAVRSGQKTWGEAGPELAAMRQKTEESLKGVLDWFCETVRSGKGDHPDP